MSRSALAFVVCLVMMALPSSRADFGGYLRKHIMDLAGVAHEQQETQEAQPQEPVLHPLKDPRRVLLDQGVDQSRREELSKDRETLINILMAAGATYLTLDDIRALPTWTQVSSLYGSEPIVYGLDTCQAYRDRLQHYNTTEAKPRVAGLFNTGTNAVAQSMAINFDPVPETVDYNLHWGKHVPPRTIYTAHYNVEGIETELPIVMVRDPMYWMQSMCKAEYNARWERGLDGRCPNLIPTQQERTALNVSNASAFHVDVIVRTQYRDHYDSLAGMWSEWNRLWLEYPLPRLMIRFEDFLFQGEKIIKTISECAGVQMRQEFSYQLEASKSHGHSSDMYSAIVKYGSGTGRIVNYTAAEKEYLRTALDPELMQLFQYKPLEAEAYAGM